MTITTVVIILTGVFGNITAEGICRLLKIQNSISRGLAIGAMSSLVVVSGVCMVVGAVLFSKFY